ncbi:zinc ribbon domain-containing protein [Streptomyces sp. 4.24]|uniref:zinc ribbon domain-containing protein n=1 Tax=Streptomyces tritrimontium TaxID=3406573 RepID=UPI003BB4F698
MACWDGSDADGGGCRACPVIRDFGKSKAKAQKDIRERLPMARRAGMPKWKKKREARPSLDYTKCGFRLKDGKLHLASGIALPVVWSRELPAEPTSVRVYQDSLGHWYCSFVVPAEVEPLAETGAVIGIDGGVRETAITTSDAHDLPHAQHGKKAAAAISATKTALVEMGRKHGRAVYPVHPAHTTVECAQCGARTKHALPLSERTYAWTVCGAVSPRDKNSAHVMLVRAGLNPAGAEGVRPLGALPQVAA